MITLEPGMDWEKINEDFEGEVADLLFKKGDHLLSVDFLSCEGGIDLALARKTMKFEILELLRKAAPDLKWDWVNSNELVALKGRQVKNTYFFGGTCPMIYAATNANTQTVLSEVRQIVTKLEEKLKKTPL